MLSSLEIAQAATLRPIADVAAEAGIEPDELEQYGRYKAKVDLSILDRLADRPDAKIINVTAITPTPAGEGKTTTSVSLTQGLGAIGRRPVLALREASLGPVFGVKGGAAGGGYAQVVPMEDLNLHFTGDLHAITAANNLLAALVDAHLLHGNELGLDPLSISWRRCMDMNDRSLRDVVTGLGGRVNGYPRQTGFDITAASEIMGLVAVARDLADLRERLGRITVGQTFEGEAVTAEDLHAAGSLTVLLKDAIKPNLVQTLEGQPAFVHCGPFANIAHGNNSLVADRVGLKLGEYLVTESGFASDMGMEKFFDITCRIGDLRPSAVVLVATVRALKHHGGNIDGGTAEIEEGAANLARHIGIIRHFGLQAVVGVNKFPTDTHGGARARQAARVEHGAYAAEINTAFEDGGQGRGGARRGGRRRRGRAVGVPLRVRVGRADRGEDPRDRDGRLRRRRSLPAQDGEGQGGRVRGLGARRPADLHGEDAPLALARRDALERADRLHRHGARPAALHRGGVDRRALRRHADDAGPREDARGARHRHRRGREHGRPVLSLPAKRRSAGACVAARSRAPGARVLAAGQPERCQRAALPVGVLGAAAGAGAHARVADGRMVDGRAGRERRHAPARAREKAVRLLPAADHAVEVERHAES